MPRLVRVGDEDDHADHPSSPINNKLRENDCNVFSGGGGSASLGLALAGALGGPGAFDIPDADAEALLGEVQNDAATIRNGGTRATSGGDPNIPYGPGSSIVRNEYAERFSGEYSDAPPASGTSDGLPADPNATARPGATPTGQGLAGPNFNNYPAIPDDSYLKFRGRTWSNGANESQIDPAVAELARSISRAVGRGQLFVNSAYRDRAKNTSADGANNSNHMYGLAMDLSFSGFSDAEKQRMLIAAIENGAGGIGIYPTFLHIDIESRRTWGSTPSWAVSIMRSAGYIS
jgi:hypothetical protein